MIEKKKSVKRNNNENRNKKFNKNKRRNNNRNSNQRNNRRNNKNYQNPQAQKDNEEKIDNNPRSVAFDTLFKIEAENAFSNIIINKQIKDNKLNRLDSAFLSSLVYGVLERKITLDYIISQYSKRSMDKLDLKTLLVLRLGVLQLLFMDKVPESAAVNESVILAKKKNRTRSSGFVNGLLRNITRAEVKYKLPDKEKDKVKYLSVKYSCPEPLINMWLKSYGEDNTKGILKNINDRPPLTANLNTLKVSKKEIIEKLESEKVEVENIPFLETGVNLKNTGSIDKLNTYTSGMFYIQDSASQLLVNILNPAANNSETVIDVCAAPGGKTFACALKMKNKGKIYAYDIYEHKLDLININARRLNITNINTEIKDASKNDEDPMLANKVMCDVPCTGYGAIRRKPEIRYNIKNEEDLISNKLKKLQYEILKTTASKVKPGGTLVYSTCTLNPEENGKNATNFLKENENFKPIPIKLPNGVKRGIEEPENHLTLFPHINGTDGFFIALFKRIKE